MSASLVGSEMCIRDSLGCLHGGQGEDVLSVEPRFAAPFTTCSARAGRPVSYTHLTLPTICSV
eukprot:1233498-Alexandrium_andersonii.AAC.1